MKNRSVLINLLIGVALLSIPFLTSPDFGNDINLLKLPPFQKILFRYFLLLLFFYFNYLFLLPKYYSKQKRWLYFSLVVGCFVAVVLVPSIVFNETVGDSNPMLRNYGIPPPEPMIDKPGVPPPEPKSPMNKPNESWSFNLFTLRDTFIFQFAMVVVLSLLLRLENKLAQIKNEKLKAEVSYLKAQINPHFLFNTLNSIYALALTKSPKAPSAILKLSDIMRYVVLESDTEKVSLEKELNYISDYIELQKLRVGKNVNLNFNIQGQSNGLEIVPIILINFVENAFKYGVNPEVDSVIDIFIQIENQTLLLKATNDIVVDKNSIIITQEGVINSKQRLDFLYPNKYKLNVKEYNNTYSLELYIDLV